MIETQRNVLLEADVNTQTMKALNYLGALLYALDIKDNKFPIGGWIDFVLINLGEKALVKRISGKGLHESLLIFNKYIEYMCVNNANLTPKNTPYSLILIIIIHIRLLI